MDNSCRAIDNGVKKDIEDSFKSFMAKYFDKGPSLARVYTSENCITIHCKDILTPLEKNLTGDICGEYLIQASRKRILHNTKAELLKIVDNNIDAKVSSFYMDLNIFDDSLCCAFIIE
ncbi:MULTISPECIES: Na-translocating system protein MpsC family protein [Bacillota]|uniref:Na+-translocating membrane potential-generating system MpsC domain-containing protein n=1 Tax=[Clostridium] ultunense Esp TaxID=1288971 RepID=A0A1M4PM44_9FIRM|nr:MULTISPECIES: Na-translocating system protein MpsC family protein [Bacillota]MCF6462349.1 DUF2294 domain-containing protein [Clostridium sp. Cult1]SHD76527.1 conserved protein of unknown function [[Clostridium] ultunense Esp]